MVSKADQLHDLWAYVEVNNFIQLAWMIADEQATGKGEVLYWQNHPWEFLRMI